MARLDDVVAHLDALLLTADTPDYGPALNGLQLANAGEVRGVAAAVDYSMAGVEGAIAAGANLPVGFPAYPIWLQAWVTDPDGPKGLAASNGVRIDVPAF